VGVSSGTALAERSIPRDWSGDIEGCGHGGDQRTEGGPRNIVNDPRPIVTITLPARTSPQLPRSFPHTSYGLTRHALHRDCGIRVSVAEAVRWHGLNRTRRGHRSIAVAVSLHRQRAQW